MWDYPQMYYFQSEQVFSLFRPGRKKKKNAELEISTFSYEFNAPLELRESPTLITEDDSGDFALDLLGRFMINTGRILLTPEPTDVVPGWSWIDEVAGVILIVGGIILVSVF